MAFYRREVGLAFFVLILSILCLIVYRSKNEISNIFEKDDIKPEMVTTKNAFGVPVGFVRMKGNIVGDVQEDENGVFSFNFKSDNLFDMNGVYKIIISWGLDDVVFSIGGENGDGVGLDDFKSLISESKDQTETGYSGYTYSIVSSKTNPNT